MHVIVADAPGAAARTVHVTAGESIAFGRGGDVVVDLVLDYPGLSRRAGFLGVFSDGRISISCYQTGGAFEVRRQNGVTANRLSTGEACVMAPGVYTVEVVGMSGPPLVFRLEADSPGPAARATGSAITVPAVSADAVLSSDPRQEWQTVLALACVLARRSPRPDGWVAPSTKQLAGIVALWFGFTPSDKWLSDRLDAALLNLNLPRDGSDKLPRLVSRTLAGRLLPDSALDEVERRLIERTR